MTSKKILIVSPFGFEPLDAGHRRRTAQSLNFFEGDSITFVLYAFEGPWLYSYQDTLVKKMRNKVSDVLVYKGRSDIGAPPANGRAHALDEWYDEKFELFLRNLCSHRQFDVVVVHNVWMSKYLDIFHRSTVKVIEAHDVFALRAQAFEDASAEPEFFIIEEKDEIFGYGRANIIVAIQEEERQWIAKRSDRLISKIVYFPPDISRRELPVRGEQYLSEESVTFGFLGSSHAFNVAGVNELLSEMKDVLADTMAPLKLLVGGTVCNHITHEASFWESIGWVESEQSFFDRVDIMIAPVMSGTGFKVKVADSACSGMPTLATDHSAIGIPLDEEWVVANVRQMASMMASISLRRPPMKELKESTRRTAALLLSTERKDVSDFRNALNAQQYILVMDFRGLHEGIALTLLAGVSGAMRIGSGRAKVLVISEHRSVQLACQRFGPNMTVAHRLQDSQTDGHPVYYFGSGEVVHSEWKSIRFTPTALYQENLFPLFGSNIKWDPFFRRAIELLVHLYPRGEYSGSVFLASSALASSIALESSGTSIKVCCSDISEDVAMLAASIVSQKVTKVIWLGKNANQLEALIARLCAVKGVNFIELEDGHAIADLMRSLEHEGFWATFFDDKRPLPAYPPNGLCAPARARVNARGSIGLDLLEDEERGFYPVEYDGAGRKMMWTSGQGALIVSVKSQKSRITVAVSGMPHHLLKEQSLIVENSIEKKVIPLISGEYMRYTTEIDNLASDMDYCDVSIGFPPGIDPAESAGGVDEKRTLSFLVYDIEIV